VLVSVGVGASSVLVKASCTTPLPPPAHSALVFTTTVTGPVESNTCPGGGAVSCML
jgi:hypothetical protein